MKLAKFLRTPYFTEHLQWLLPEINVQENVPKSLKSAYFTEIFTRYILCGTRYNDFKPIFILNLYACWGCLLYTAEKIKRRRFRTVYF